MSVALCAGCYIGGWHPASLSSLSASCSLAQHRMSWGLAPALQGGLSQTCTKQCLFWGVHNLYRQKEWSCTGPVWLSFALIPDDLNHQKVILAIEWSCHKFTGQIDPTSFQIWQKHYCVFCTLDILWNYGMDGIMPLLFPQLFSSWEYCNFSASFTMPTISQQSFLGQIDVLFPGFVCLVFCLGFVVFFLTWKVFFFPVDQSEDF